MASKGLSVPTERGVLPVPCLPRPLPPSTWSGYLSSICFVPDAILAAQDKNEASRAPWSASMVQHGDGSIDRVLWGWGVDVTRDVNGAGGK